MALQELNTLINIGIHFGQGYYLGRPVYPATPPNDEIFARLIHLTSASRNNILKHAFPIMEISENATSVRKDMCVCDVKEILDNNDLQGVVVLDALKEVSLCGTGVIEQFAR